MIGNFTYFTLSGSTFTEDSTNGHIPGITWTDENGHNYRAICTALDFANFMMKSISYDYSVYIQPVGLSQWMKNMKTKVFIDNDNIIEVATGDIVTSPDAISTQYQNPTTLLYTRTINDGVSGYMYQFDYFVMLVGKNIPNVPISLYAMVQVDILKREGLTLS